MTTITVIVIVVLILGVLLWALFPSFKYRLRDVKDYVGDTLSDPVKDHGHRIDDAKKKVHATREQVVEAIAANKQLKVKAESANRDVAKYARLAANAAGAGDKEAVTKFVAEKQRAVAREKVYLTQIDANDHVISSVKEQIDERNEQIENAASNKEILEAQLLGTKLRQDMTKTRSGLQDDDLGDLGILQAHVDAESARADAYEEVYGKSDDDLEEKYSAEGSTVDDEVELLLSKHGVKQAM